jgi:hypothetical protein
MKQLAAELGTGSDDFYANQAVWQVQPHAKYPPNKCTTNELGL